jgi:hypothetical protein
MAGEIPGLESSENRLVPPAGFDALPGILSKADQLCRQAPRWPAPVGLQSKEVRQIPASPPSRPSKSSNKSCILF